VVARGAEGRRRRYVDGVAVDGDPFRETGGRRDRGQDVRVADSGLGRRRGAHASGKEKRQGDQKRGDGEGGKGWAAAHHAPPDWYFRIPICQAVFLESSPEWVISLGGVSVRGQRDGGWARVLLDVRALHLADACQVADHQRVLVANEGGAAVRRQYVGRE